MPKQKYEENPSREVNMAIGGGVGILLGGLLLGFPGALVGGGIGAVIGSERGDTGRRRLLENERTIHMERGSSRCPRGMQMQTLLLDRRSFSRAEAISWARRNGYAAHKVDTTANKYRLRQRPPSHFTRGSFRTISLSDRVQAVIGCPRR